MCDQTGKTTESQKENARPPGGLKQIVILYFDLKYAKLASVDHVPNHPHDEPEGEEEHACDQEEWHIIVLFAVRTFPN